MTSDRPELFKTGDGINAENRFKTRGILIRIFQMLGALILGFLFCAAKAPLNTYPFAAALVSSLSASPAFAALGVIARFLLSTELQSEIFPYCAAAILACSARYVFCFLFIGKKILTSGRLSDGILARVLTASVVSLGAGLVRSALGHYDAQLLVGGVFSMCAAGALTFLFTSLFDSRYTFPSSTEAGAAVLMLVISLSLSGLSVFNIASAIVFSFAATLWCGYCGGAARGCAVGFLLGLGCGGGLSVAFALAGLCAGLFFPVSTVASAAASLVAAICCGIVTGGTEFTMTFLPEALLGSIIITIPAILKIMPVFSLSEASSSAALCRDLTEKKQQEENKMRVHLLSESMASLSQIIRNLSSKMRRPDEHSLENMCRAVWAESCVGCPMDCPCKDISSVSSDNSFGRLVTKLMSAGKINPDKLGDFSRAKCPKKDEIIDEINERASHMIEHAVKYDKTQIFAFDYESMSRLMSDALSQSNAGYSIDRILSDRLRKALLRAGLPAENIVVCGDRKKHIIATGGSLVTSSLGVEDIRGICENVCKTRFSRPEFTLTRGCAAMTLEGERSYGVSFTGKQTEKRGENICGDSVSVLETREGYFYCFICDGMGSGSQAALTSRICRVFLEKMLACGNDKTTALEMLNMFLKNKGTECFATVDMLEVDLHLGTAAFIKSGAAPSYIMRSGSLFRIASGTLPVGILSDISAELTEFDLKKGDVIVMASDGIAGDFEAEDEKNPSWFADFLCREWTEDLSVMTEKILLAASREGRRSDDMTVELIRIEEPENNIQPSSENNDSISSFSA